MHQTKSLVRSVLGKYRDEEWETMIRIRVAEVASQNKGWTMKAVADALDVEHQTVLYWNQGRSYPRLPMLLRLCGLLDCKIQELVECPSVINERRF